MVVAVCSTNPIQQGICGKIHFGYEVSQCFLKCVVYKVQEVFFHVVYCVTKSEIIQFQKKLSRVKCEQEGWRLGRLHNFRLFRDTLISSTQNCPKPFVELDTVEKEARKCCALLLQENGLSEEEKQDFSRVQVDPSRMNRGMCWAMVMDLASRKLKENKPWEDLVCAYSNGVDAKIVGRQITRGAVMRSSMKPKHKDIFDILLYVQHGIEASNLTTVFESRSNTAFEELSKQMSDIFRLFPSDLMCSIQTPRHIMLLHREGNGKVAFIDPNIGLFRCTEEKVFEVLRRVLIRYKNQKNEECQIDWKFNVERILSLS